MAHRDQIEFKLTYFHTRHLASLNRYFCIVFSLTHPSSNVSSPSLVACASYLSAHVRPASSSGSHFFTSFSVNALPTNSKQEERETNKGGGVMLSSFFLSASLLLLRVSSLLHSQTCPICEGEFLVRILVDCLHHRHGIGHLVGEQQLVCVYACAVCVCAVCVSVCMCVHAIKWPRCEVHAALV